MCVCVCVGGGGGGGGGGGVHVHTQHCVPCVSKGHSEHLLMSSLQELHHCWDGAAITGVGFIVLGGREGDYSAIILTYCKHDTAAHIPQGKQDRILGPVGIAIRDVIRTKPPFRRLVGEDIVHILLYLHRAQPQPLVVRVSVGGERRVLHYRANEDGVLQLVGEGDKPIEPVRRPLVQPPISLASHPAGVHHVRPEELEVPREALCLQLQLVQQPACGIRDRRTMNGHA